MAGNKQDQDNEVTWEGDYLTLKGQRILPKKTIEFWITQCLKDGFTPEEILNMLRRAKRDEFSIPSERINELIDRLVDADILKEDEGEKVSFGEGDVFDPKFTKVVRELGMERKGFNLLFTAKQIEELKKELAKKDVEIKRLKVLPVKYSGVMLDSLFATEKTIKGLIKLIGGDIRSREVAVKFIKDGFGVIKLGVDEHRCIHALFSLYTKYGYPDQGVALHWADYYRAFGLKEWETKDGLRFSGYGVKKARASLEKLKKTPIPLMFKFTEKEGKNKVEFAVIRKSPFCEVIELYKLTDKEKIDELPMEFKQIKDYSPEKHLIVFKINKMLLKKHNQYFKLVDSNFYEKMRKIKKPGERISAYHFRLLLWLAKQLGKEISFDREFLAKDVLRMSKQILKDKQHRDKIIFGLYSDLKKAGYLTKYILAEPKIRGGFKDTLCLDKVAFFKKEQLVLAEKGGGG